MNTITLAICLITIVGLWGHRSYVQSKRDDCALLARNAWQARRAARAAAEGRRGR